MKQQAYKRQTSDIYWLNYKASHTQLVEAKPHADSEHRGSELLQSSYSLAMMLNVCSPVPDPKLNYLTNYLLGIFDEVVLLKRRKGAGGGVAGTFMRASQWECIRDSLKRWRGWRYKAGTHATADQWVSKKVSAAPSLSALIETCSSPLWIGVGE